MHKKGEGGFVVYLIFICLVNINWCTHEAAIPYPELLAYAQSISAFTSAPPGLAMPEPGAIGPVPLFFPPFPNEEMMRRGRLNAERPLGGLGENHSVRGEWFFNNECILLVVGFCLSVILCLVQSCIVFYNWLLLPNIIMILRAFGFLHFFPSN
jgi:hypothetical protein